MNSKKTEEREEMKKAESKKEKKKKEKRQIFRDAIPKMENVTEICCKNNKPDNVQRNITFCS